MQWNDKKLLYGKIQRAFFVEKYILLIKNSVREFDELVYRMKKLLPGEVLPVQKIGREFQWKNTIKIQTHGLKTGK